MLSADDRQRYLRHLLLREIGGQGQQKLLAARVLVVGAGGLGSPVIQYLAAAGVGTIGIVDDDTVDLSNLQRQVIYATDDVGRMKAVRAAAAARALNPAIAVTAYPVRFDGANAAQLLANHDLVIEGVDSFAARYDINTACLAARAPLVSAAIGRFEGQLSLFKPYAGNLPCYRCFAPAPPPADRAVNCAEEGVVGPLAGVMGSLAALEALKEIAGFGDTLAGRLLVYDGLSHRMRNVLLPRDPACMDCGRLEREGF